MNTAAPKDGIVNIGGAKDVTDHVIRLRKGKLSNYLPFRRWFDALREDGTSLWQFREGGSAIIDNEDCYSFRIDGVQYYPTDTQEMGEGSEANLTWVADVPVLANVLSNGVYHIPDLVLSKSKIY